VPAIARSSESLPDGPQPLLSIIVNNYNYDRFLRAAIDSALAQTYRNLEVIVVDDGSTDRSRDLIESYGQRISPVFKPNGGQGSSFNAGFATSRGDLVMFLDADDQTLPTMAAEVVRRWRPGVAKVQFQLEMVDADGKPLGRHVPHFNDFVPNGDMRDRILRFGEYPSAPSSGNVYARAALTKLMPLDESDWFISADTPLFMLTPFFGDVLTITVPLGRYRVHDTNDSGLKGRQVDALHRRLTKVSYLPDTIWKSAQRAGIELDREVLNSRLRYVKLRMTSLCLDPTTHPIHGDNRLRLWILGLRASVRQPNLTVRIRLSNMLWFSLMAVSTRKIASYLSEPSR
jgi:glycosyltransferase involved in cell wall biosynthesis